VKAPSLPSSLRREGPWVGAALLVMCAVWLVGLLRDGHRYWRGDAQNAYYGWWYALGDALRHGEWPLIDPTTLPAGGHVIEGQMGLYNPITALVGLGATVAPDLVVYRVLVTIAVGTIAVVGAYGLCRSFAVPPPLAAAAATAVSLCGYTLVFAAPRWYTGHLQVALLPWAWWLTRRAMRGRSPLPAMAAAALLITVGYVHGVLYLGLVLLVSLLEAVLSERTRAATLRVVGVGAVAALVAVPVFLPGVLSLGVTVRQAGFGSGEGRIELDPWQLPFLWQPAADPTRDWFAATPWRYTFWWVPLLFLVDWRRFREQWRALTPLWAGALFWLLWTLGPYEIGPIRWPGRVMDTLTLMLAVATIVTLSRCVPRRPPVRRIGYAVGYCAITSLVVVLGFRWQSAWDAVSGLVVIGLLLAVWWVIEQPVRAGAVLLVGSLGLGVAAVTLNGWLEAIDRHMPSSRAAYDEYLRGVPGSVLAIKGPRTERRDYSRARAEEALTGSLWHLAGPAVINGYTTTSFHKYSKRFCSTFDGSYCSNALPAFRRTEPTTGRTYLQLFGINALLIEKGAWLDERPIPHGWHVESEGRRMVLWVRDEPLPRAGSVSWTSPGVSLSHVERSRLGVSFRVDEVPPEGGTVVLSRIPWPGYAVSGAGELDDPVDDVLLTVHVPGDAAGRTTSVTYRPPGWEIGWASLGAAALIAVGWSGGRRLAHRRSERARVRSEGADAAV